jgi:hypothetical protein
MNYFVLLNIFPPEIVNIIYKFILIQKSGEKILHNVKYYHLKNSILYNSLDNILKTNPLNNNYSLISDDNIYYLDFVLNNYYPNNMIISYFWHNYLNLLSAKIMNINTFIIIDENKHDYKYKNSLRKVIVLWFALCNKFNITLKFGFKKYPNNISNNETIIIICDSKKFYKSKLKNFNNFVFAPIVIDNYGVQIDWFDSSINLEIRRDDYYDKFYSSFQI